MYLLIFTVLLWLVQLNLGVVFMIHNMLLGKSTRFEFNRN